jgi:streptogramin lyase
VHVDPATNEVVARIDVGGSAGALAAGDDDVWVSVDATDLVRISESTDEVVYRSTIGSEGAPLVGVDVGTDGVWGLLDFALAIVRVDAETGDVVDELPLCGEDQCRVGAAATSEGLTAGALWLVDDTTDKLLMIEPESLSIVERVGLPQGAWHLAAGPAGVFLLDTENGMLERVDPHDPQDLDLAPDRFERATTFVVGDESVYVYDSLGEEIVSVDAEDLGVRARIPIDHVRTLAAG